MVKRFSRLLLLLALPTLFLLTGVPAESGTSCNTYYNSRAGWVFDQFVCHGTGGGCQECVDSNYNYCVTGSSGVPWCEGPDFNY